MTFDPHDVLLFIEVTNKDDLTFNIVIGLLELPAWKSDRLHKSIEVIRVASSKTQMDIFVRSFEFKKGKTSDQHRVGTPKRRQRTLG